MQQRRKIRMQRARSTRPAEEKPCVARAQLCERMHGNNELADAQVQAGVAEKADEHVRPKNSMI